MTDTICSDHLQSGLFEYASYYAETMGWAVFPAPPGEKKSYLSEKYSEGRKWGATRDPGEVRRIFEQFPGANIGIPTGEVSGIFVVEADTLAGHDVDGIASLAMLEAEHGPLPATLQAESPSGSVHFYFLHPGFLVRNSASKLAPGIDVRGDGGMVIAPPSIKPGKGVYKWRNGLPIADAPTWLLDAVKKSEGSRTTGSVPDAVDGLSHDGIRYDELCWWIATKVDRWDSGIETLSNDQWISLGKRIKLSFPGDDGLNAFLAMSWAEKHDAIARRWWDPVDFKIEGENLETLPALLKHDIEWMFRHAAGCPKPPSPPAHIEIPPEVLEQHQRERDQHLAAAIGPLPDHPELPIDQANALTNFWAHLPSGKIIHEPSRGLWASGSFDKHCGRIKDAMRMEGPGMLASTWLSQHRAVQSMGWDPGEPMIIEDRILADDWVRAPGCRSFNLYLPSSIVPIEGDVSIWLDHIKFIYPGEWQHIVLWFGHRVQRPGEKVNHGLVFIGQPGVGKDTAIEPVVAAIGSQNFKSISAKTFFTSDFNGYLKSVLLRIDEVHDLGGESKYAFHDRTKPILAAPPAAHYVNEKNIPHHSARNVCGVILTSNHADALYLDRNDRRHFVCISDRKKEDFLEGYFDRIYAWFESGGNAAVAHYLATLDLTGFNAKTPPPKTAGWHMVVAAGLAPESGDLADVIETLGKPAALTLSTIRAQAPMGSSLRLAFDDAKLRRAIPKRLAECGYIAVANPDARESGGRWRMNGGKTTIYARQELSESERLTEARALSLPMPPAPPY